MAQHRSAWFGIEHTYLKEMLILLTTCKPHRTSIFKPRRTSTSPSASACKLAAWLAGAFRLPAVHIDLGHRTYVGSHRQIVVTKVTELMLANAHQPGLPDTGGLLVSA